MPPTNASSTTSPPSAPRSRLRGFSYLRSHGLHHSSNHNNGTNGANSNTNNLTAPVAAEQMSNANPNLSPPASPSSPRRSTSPLTNNNPTTNGGGTSSWLPTVGGISGLSRVPTAPAAESSNAVRSHSPSGKAAADGAHGAPLTRAISEGAPLPRSIDATLSSNNEAPAISPGTASAGASGAAVNQAQQSAVDAQQPPPSIRFVPHIDPRSTRQSLTFPPMERTLRHNDEVIRVGRYSDRDAGNPSPVGFKSKVVSRRHCEFWCSKGQWYVKDVKSSSGTFLNHIRLSSPGVESKAFPLFDGDIIQLGIDFKGGEELIFRCVKIRVELNRAWQKGLNNFNMSTHKKLQNLGKNLKPKDSDTSSTHTSECSICLMNVAPCQSLFVAPCSHVWHYKCVRPIILKSYPTFLCPNCRAVADLERDIEEDNAWQMVEDEPPQPALPVVNAQSDQDEDGVVVVTSAQSAAAAAVEPPTATAAEPPSQPLASLAMSSEIPPTIAANGGHRSDSEMTGTGAGNENLHGPEPESPPMYARSASSFVNENNHQQIMNGANETFVSLDSNSNHGTAENELEHSAAPSLAMSALDLNHTPDQGNNGEGSSSRPIAIAPPPKRKPLRNGSDSTPSLNLGLTVAGSSRDETDPDHPIHGDNGPLTPKNHIGPFVLDGLGG